MTVGQTIIALRWFLAASLLMGGLILLSVPVSAYSIWWIKLGPSPTSLSFPLPTRLFAVGFVSVTLTATIFVARRSFRSAVYSAYADTRQDFVWPLWLSLYVATVVALHHVLNGGSPDHVLTPLHISYIVILTIAAAASWCLGAMPAQFWVAWCGRSRPGVLVGAVLLGTLAYALGRHYTPLAVADLWVLAGPLQRWTVSLSASLLRLLADNVVFDPKQALIGTQDFAVYIDAGCAGWEGIALFLVFFSFYLIAYRNELRFPRALLLLFAGVVLIWCFNVVRIVALILIGSVSDSIGAYGFHSIAGWLLFNLATIALVAVSQRLSFFLKEIPAASHRHSVSNPALPYLLPLLIMVAAGMVTRAFFPILSFPVQMVAGGTTLWLFRRKIMLPWTPSWFPVLLGFLVFGVWLAATRAGSILPAIGASIVSPSASGTAGALWLSLRIIGVVIVVPLAEEFAFRGYLLRKLVDSRFETVSFQRFTWFSFLGSSFVFGILHDQWFAGCMAGMAFALALHRRGYLSDAVLSHAVANGLLAAYILAGPGVPLN